MLLAESPSDIIVRFGCYFSSGLVPADFSKFVCKHLLPPVMLRQGMRSEVSLLLQ